MLYVWLLRVQQCWEWCLISSQSPSLSRDSAYVDMAIGRLIPYLNLILAESNWERPKNIIFISELSQILCLRKHRRGWLMETPTNGNVDLTLLLPPLYIHTLLPLCIWLCWSFLPLYMCILRSEHMSLCTAQLQVLFCKLSKHRKYVEDSYNVKPYPLHVLQLKITMVLE